MALARIARLALVLLSPALSSAARAQASPPATGRDALEAMRAAYGPERWFTTLTFTQATTQHRPDGRDTISTWYESLRYTEARGTQLRIDVGEPSDGNGVLYSPDSLWAFRRGAQVAARPGGNALLPLVEGAYVQSVARTVAELAPTKVDLSRPVVMGSWNDRPVWIVGAAAAGDTASPQFWVDTATKAVVRAIFSPVAGVPVMDMRLLKLEPVGGGWLATRCEFWVGGQLRQVEEYQNWRAGVDLAPGLFDPATFSTAPHWVQAPL